MAKKIRLDFSKVEERSGYNQRQMPEGLYEAKVTSLEQRDAQDGTPMLVYGIRPTATKYATRNFPNYCKLQQNQLWKLRDLFIAAGETIPKKATQIDPEKILGKIVAIEVGDGTGQYTDRSEIVSVYPMSILDELSGNEPDEDDDEDEEEYDDESEEEYDDSDDDSGDEDDEDLDEDEDDEEFEDDDEDLDEDEDDDDEDELDEDGEDDEEEEEPAPKRPTKKAPAKKAPAKKPAAKKAAEKPAAKRTVKRSR